METPGTLQVAFGFPVPTPSAIVLAVPEIIWGMSAIHERHPSRQKIINVIKYVTSLFGGDHSNES
jgi:hypothetical protein